MGPKRYHKWRVLALGKRKIASEYRWRLRICETAFANGRQGAVCYIVDWTQVNKKNGEKRDEHATDY